MSTADLDTYLLNKWEDLDAAVARANALETAVYEALAEEVRKWAAARGWSGVFTVDDLWFAPPQWVTKPAPRPDAYAWFVLDDEGTDDDAYCLTVLMGLNRGEAGFAFRQSRLPVRQWKPRATSPELMDALPGFSIKGGSPFHPFKLEREAVLDAAAGEDFSQVAQPVLDVLDRLEQAVPILSDHLAQT